MKLIYEIDFLTKILSELRDFEQPFSDLYVIANYRYPLGIFIIPRKKKFSLYFSKRALKNNQTSFFKISSQNDY